MIFESDTYNIVHLVARATATAEMHINTSCMVNISICTHKHIIDLYITFVCTCRCVCEREFVCVCVCVCLIYVFLSVWLFVCFCVSLVVVYFLPFYTLCKHCLRNNLNIIFICAIVEVKRVKWHVVVARNVLLLCFQSYERSNIH